MKNRDSLYALDIRQCATLACLLEVSAPKPGNVHRGADFDDLRFEHFLISAVAIAPAMEAAVEKQALGRTVLEAVRATRQAVNANTNLGTVLLMAPLAMVPRPERLRTGVARVLASVEAEDSRHVYQAIRLAQPAGLGRVDEYDIAEEPPSDLVAAMRTAAPRDMVARQYANDFAQVLEQVVPWLREATEREWSMAQTIVHVQMRLMAEFPDSLIARKCGTAVAQESSARAAAVLRSGLPGDEDYLCALADFDFWLRSDHHRRNPGTTADLIAAGLFAMLRDGELPLGRVSFS
jgi:triphosphoribosyl-dephospho-CoA synthase